MDNLRVVVLIVFLPSCSVQQVVPAATIRSIFKYVTQFRAAGAPATEVSWLQFATAMRLAAAYQACGNRSWCPFVVVVLMILLMTHL